MKNSVCCVIPNWNGKESLGDALDSLLAQSQDCQIIVVENGSVDGSADFVEQKYPQVTLLKQPRNLGFAGGVNVGIRHALGIGAKYVALFNNDAVADPSWLKLLVDALDQHPKAGIATGKLVDRHNQHLDSTGDIYTTWGLPFPRGRGEPVSDKYDDQNWVLGASGGASLYRVTMLQKIGLFDEDFFAYYEDADISFRAQLAGYKVYYQPKALVRHQIGATSGKIKGFTTYQTLKNLPMIVTKNVPASLLPTVLPRFLLAYGLFILSALARGQFSAVIKGLFMAVWYKPKKLVQRRKIQKNRTVRVDYLRSIMTWDLPPNATRLRHLRARWWRLIGRRPA
jgi:GT2 family glycosyltransferase